MNRCEKCGRFMKRIRDGVGLPLVTGFPPDKQIAGTIPYAPFACWNHRVGRVEYKPVSWSRYEG